MSKAHKGNEKKNIYACLAQRDIHVTPSAMKVEPLSPITSCLDFTQQYIPQTSHLKGLFCLISHAITNMQNKYVLFSPAPKTPRQFLPHKTSS